MPIVQVNGGGNTPQGVDDGDVDGRDFLAWQRGDSPSSNEIVVTKVTDVSSTLLLETATPSTSSRNSRASRRLRKRASMKGLGIGSRLKVGDLRTRLATRHVHLHRQ